MLKPILKNSKPQNLSYYYSNCTFIGKSTSHKGEISSNSEVWDDGSDSLHLNRTVNFAKQSDSPVKKRGSKKVQFGSVSEQHGSTENKRRPQSSKHKAQKKQIRGENTGTAFNEDLPVRGGLDRKECLSIWDYNSTRWAARLHDLVEMEEALKCIQSKSSGTKVYFSDSQAHLRVGSGPDYTSVFVGVMDGDTKVAVKKINVKRAPLLQDEARQQLLMTMSSNSCLAKVHFISRDKTQFYIVRELCENSLKLEMKMRQFIPEAIRPAVDCRDICHEIAKAVALLHANNCPHMALRPENIFFTASGGVKLADYGMHERNITKKKQYESAVPLCWLPSEALGCEVRHLTKATDISSLGMVFFWLITEGSHPFGDPENAADACLKSISHGHYNLKALVDPFAHHLVQHMIFKEQKKRMTITEVLHHPFFWTNDQRAEYVKLLAKTIHLISGNSVESDSMSMTLVQFLKTKERSILRSCADLTLLKDIPNDAKTDLTKLLTHVHACCQRGIGGADFLGFVSDVYPGIVLELHFQFPTEDLENLISELTYVVGTRDKLDHHFMLQPCLSADSGIGSPVIDLNEHGDFDGLEISTFPFEKSRRNREDSDCYASTDDGIDILSPLCGSLTDESVFSSPMKMSPNEFKEKLNTTNASSFGNEGYSSSVDNHFEFDRTDWPFGENILKKAASAAEWTDMDELD